jgi:hypothetical protein
LCRVIPRCRGNAETPAKTNFLAADSAKRHWQGLAGDVESFAYQVVPSRQCRLAATVI